MLFCTQHVVEKLLVDESIVFSACIKLCLTVNCQNRWKLDEQSASLLDMQKPETVFEKVY